MIYVLDTNAFIVLGHFYPATFSSLWAEIDDLAALGTLQSTREVFNELQNSNESVHIQEWAKAHKGVFAMPSNEELEFVQKIFQVKRFDALIGQKALLKGTPVADPFVIAAAAVKQGTVVTQERLKPNAAKIPNVCAHFKIPCIDLERFMKLQKWNF